MRRSWSATARAVAGPLLIVGGVLVVLQDFAFRGLITFTQGDVAAYWLPTYCHLGRSLAAGAIPAWNPFSLAGAPFAADPQSGWMYLPAMVLFSVFSCDLALRLYIVLLPMLAGLGTYWFLRTEGVGRVPATVGGLVLSLGVAGSRMAVNVPFSATLAWTPVLLAAAARYLRAGSWGARLGWLTAAAAAWGQLAAAHLSHGFVIGSGALFVYVVARSVTDVRDGKRTGAEAVAMGALLLPALLLVNLAFFLPRVAYLPRTTLGEGYAGLYGLADRLAGRPERPFPIGPTAGLRWPFLFAVSPGPYLGAGSLALAFGGWWSRRHRPVVLALGLFGLVCFVLSLGVVARFIEPVARALPLGDFYLYSPFRFRYALFVVLAVLAGFGLDAWVRAPTWRDRMWMLVPGVGLWWILPLAVGVRPERLWLLATGGVVIGLALAASIRRRSWLVAVPVLVAVELAANGLIGQASSGEFFDTGIGDARTVRPLTPLLEPTIDAASYVQPGPLAAHLRSSNGGRYLSLDPGHGYLGYQDPAGWPFLTDQRGMLFGIEEAQGYNPVQPIRYWAFVRAVNPDPELHNVSVLGDPSPAVLDLLGIEWIIAPAGTDLEPTAVPLVEEGAWALYRVADPAPRASVVQAWTIVSGRDAALDAVTRPGFDPRTEVVLEEAPGVSQAGGAAGSATYSALGPQAARIELEAAADSILVVRNGYDPNWKATVDGRSAAVLPVDGFLQGIPVPAGRHSVALAYDDPWIGIGLAGSGVALVGLAGAGLILRRRSRASATSSATPQIPHAPAEAARPKPTASSS